MRATQQERRGRGRDKGTTDATLDSVIATDWCPQGQEDKATTMVYRTTRLGEMSQRRRGSVAVLPADLSSIVFSRFGKEIVDKYYGVSGQNEQEPQDDETAMSDDASSSSAPSPKRRRKASRPSSAMLIPNPDLCLPSRRLLIGVNEITRQVQRAAAAAAAASDDPSAAAAAATATATTTLSPSLVLIHLPPTVPAPLSNSFKSSSLIPNMYHPLFRLTSSFFPFCRVVVLTSSKEAEDPSPPPPPSSSGARSSSSKNAPPRPFSPLPPPSLGFGAILFPDRRRPSRPAAAAAAAAAAASSPSADSGNKRPRAPAPSAVIAAPAKGRRAKDKRRVSIVAFFEEEKKKQPEQKSSNYEERPRWEKSFDSFVDFVKSEVDVAETKLRRKN